MDHLDEPIRWLHLSDFHTGSDPGGQRRLFKDLLKHIEHYIEEEEARPDMVFITGDIAHSGKADEYAFFFDEFLFGLLSCVSDNLPANIFLIPGNHDIERQPMDFRVIRPFYQDFPKALDPDNPGTKLRSPLIERFRGYIGAKDMHDCTPIVGDWPSSVSGAYISDLTIKSKKIGILGLNTAWFSCQGENEQDTDEKKMTPGLMIVADGLDELERRQCGLKIVLGHHQIDWFLEKEREAIRSRFAQSGVIYLHGDQHKSRVRLEDAGTQKFLTIESGAAFQERNSEVWVNRLLWCKFYPDEQVIRIHPRVWRKDDQSWKLDSSLPGDQVHGTDYWQYDLPNADKKQRNDQRSTVSIRRNFDLNKPPFEGWKFVSQGFLEKRRDKLNSDEALTYFDGGDVNWEVALSSMIPRRGVVKELYDAVLKPRKAAPVVTVLLGGGGEGKSTALLQAASKLLNSQSTWTMLWQEKIGTHLPPNFWNNAQFKEGDWFVVADEADLIIADINDMVRYLPPERRSQFNVLLCCRDTDWRSSRADSLTWNRDSLVKIPEKKPLGGIDEKDAALIIKAWKECKEDGSGLGKLQKFTEEGAVRELVKMAKSEEANKDDSGAFLGAMLQARFEGNLQNHVLSLLKKLEARELDKPHNDETLLDAFAYIATLHAEGITILTEEILARCLNVDKERETGYIDRRVINLLRQEVGTSIRRSGDNTQRRVPTILTRHKIIAQAAVKVLSSDSFHFDSRVWAEMYKKLVKSAIKIYKDKIAYVPELGVWRQLPAHFANQKGAGLFFRSENERKDFAVELAEMLVNDVDRSDPLYVTQLAELYDDNNSAVATFREGAKNIPEARRDKIYYHDWAKVEGTASNIAMSAWLDAIALDDRAPKPTRKDNYTPDGYAMMFLHGMAINFQKLAVLYPAQESIFRPAWVAAVQLGVRLNGNFMTEQTHKDLAKSHSDMKGINEMETPFALQCVRYGIKAAWELREDTSLNTLKEPDELTFGELTKMYGITR